MSGLKSHIHRNIIQNSRWESEEFSVFSSYISNTTRLAVNYGTLVCNVEIMIALTFVTWLHVVDQPIPGKDNEIAVYMIAKWLFRLSEYHVYNIT